MPKPRPSWRYAFGRCCGKSAKASRLPIRQLWRQPYRTRQTLDGKPRCLCCSRGSFISTAPTRSCACSSMNAGFRASGSNCIKRIFALASCNAIAEAIDRAIDSLRGEELIDQGPVTAINQQRLIVLRKIQPALAPASYADLRRDARTAVTVSARVRVGLSRICQDLAAKSAGDSAGEANAEQIEVFPVTGALRVKRKPVAENDSLAVTLSSWSDPTWEVKDRSVAGLRIAATGGVAQSLALGALVAVRQSDIDGWLLGVARRLNKISTEEVEVGVNIIAARMIAVTLAAKRKPQEDMGYVVDGLDISTMGQRFDGLYLPPPSRPDKPLTTKTLIVPTSEYAEGRHT